MKTYISVLLSTKSLYLYLTLTISYPLQCVSMSAAPTSELNKPAQNYAADALPNTLIPAVSAIYATASCVSASQKASANILHMMHSDVKRLERAIKTNSSVLSSYHHLTNHLVILKQNSAIEGCEILIMVLKPPVDKAFISWIYNGITNFDNRTADINGEQFRFDLNICGDDGTSYMFLFYGDDARLAGAFYVGNFDAVIRTINSGKYNYRGLFKDATQYDQMLRSGIHLSNMSEFYPGILLRLAKYSNPSTDVTSDCRMLFLRER